MRTGDGHIIRKCLDGDAEAFGFLVDKYKSSLYAFIYARVGDFHDAEDLTQEVFLNAYEKLGTLKRWDNFFAWLYSIAANRCKNYWRSQSRRPDTEYVEDQDVVRLDLPSLEAYQKGLRYEALHDALASLSETHRQVLTLYYLGGMKSKEIAQFLGTSPETINMRLSRARSQLKEEMITMMTTTFAGQRLQPAFTFRVVEMIKGTKIQIAPTKTSLPWGISITGVLIVAFLSLTIPHSPIYPIGELIGSALPSETKVADVGVIPVDTVKVTEITILTSEKGDGDFGQAPKPDPMNAFAPAGQQEKWRKRTDMPTPRADLSISVVDGKIYAIGGWTLVGVEQVSISTVEMYDPATNTWTRKADVPTPRCCFSTSVVNGKIYAIGGATDLLNPFPTVEVYDPVTDTWTQGADMPTPRTAFSTSVVNGKIYAIGGTPNLHASLSIVEEYDPATDTWTKKANMPTPRWSLFTSVVNGKIYAIGGGRPDLFVAFPIVEKYDPSTDTWTKKADMPTARWAFSTSVVNERIYGIGGTPDLDVALPTVEVYQPAMDTWTQEVGMLTPRFGHRSGVVTGKIYTIGGATSLNNITVLSTVEEFDPEFTPESTPSWENVTDLIEKASNGSAQKGL